MKYIASSIIILISYIQLLSIPLTIFYTNDTHGVFQSRNYNIDGTTYSFGGYNELECVLNMQRSNTLRSIYLDAGDQQTGSVFSSYKYHDAIGGAVVEVFNMLGLDATTFGNHEFDVSYQNTENLIKSANYPFVSTNIVEKKTGKPFNDKPYIIIRKDSLDIGIMGLTLLDLQEKVKVENVKDLDLIDYKAAIDKYIDEVDSQTDLIVLLTHIGIEADSLLATQLDNRIDLIIGGHTHTVLEQPLIVKGILIVQTGAFLINLGKLDINVIDDHIQSWKNELLPVVPLKQHVNSRLSQFVQDISDNIETEMNAVIGVLPYDWIPDKYKSTALSRWMAEALYQEYKDNESIDLAMVNCGGFRKAVPSGIITMKDMTELIPFQNTVSFFTCTGQELLNFLQLNDTLKTTKDHDIIDCSFSSLHGCKSQESDVKITLDNGELIYIDLNKIYHVAAHDYIVGQCEKYLGFEPKDVISTDVQIMDVMVKQIKRQFNEPIEHN